MTCYHPIDAYKARHVNPSGKRGIVFNKRDGFTDLPVKIACGQCIGCRLERSRQWAMRCVHEAQLHDENCFLTLTYDDAHLPEGGTLVKKHFQDFMKRLREFLDGKKISFFHCGEYGDYSRRPHYHCLLFGHEFADKKFYKNNFDGSPLFTSSDLERIWGNGFCVIGALTFESAAYCARYIMKKITGDRAAKHYEVVERDTGLITNLEPEYITMSLKPAIGKEWYAKYKAEVDQNDSVVMRGMEMRPPKYYDKRHESLDKIAHDKVKLSRIKKAVPFKANNTPERLAVREEVVIAGMSNFKREV